MRGRQLELELEDGGRGRSWEKKYFREKIDAIWWEMGEGGGGDGRDCTPPSYMGDHLIFKINHTSASALIIHYLSPYYSSLLECLILI